LTPPAATALPTPSAPLPARNTAAQALLVELRRVDHRLLLGERDVRRLAPGVEAWLERGASTEAIIAALTVNLPDKPRSAGGLIAHRLAVQLPPRLGPVHYAVEHARPDPFQTCTRCDRAFRSPVPGTCRECREEEAERDGHAVA
jgi:hypothetical protein